MTGKDQRHSSRDAIEITWGVEKRNSIGIGRHRIECWIGLRMAAGWIVQSKQPDV
jgi:hypothetical protein